MIENIENESSTANFIVGRGKKENGYEMYTSENRANESCYQIRDSYMESTPAVHKLSQLRELQVKVNLMLNQILAFRESGKPEYPRKNLFQLSSEPTKANHIWCRVMKYLPCELQVERI